MSMADTGLTDDLIARVTKDDLKTCHMREAQHYNGGKEWFGYRHVCVEHPRLSRFDKYTRADKGVQSTWAVDGKDCADLDAALEALAVPVVLTDDEMQSLTFWRDHPEEAWATRVEVYGMMFALSDKGLIEVAMASPMQAAAQSQPPAIQRRNRG